MIKFGDAVRLKSGGPRMLVTDIGDFIQCDWLDDDGQNCSHGYRWFMLIPA